MVTENGSAGGDRNKAIDYEYRLIRRWRTGECLYLPPGGCAQLVVLDEQRLHVYPLLATGVSVRTGGVNQGGNTLLARRRAHRAIDYSGDDADEIVLTVTLLEAGPGKLVGAAVPGGHDLIHLGEQQRVELCVGGDFFVARR